jgi:Uma2 family endonuclease
MSFEEFLSSPFERAEWVDGEVFELSPENSDHSSVSGFLYHLLAAVVEERDLGTVLTGMLMKAGPHLAGRVPDILYVSRDHESRIGRNHIDGPADIVVEIVSPESTTRDRETKRREYELGGVREYWLIDLLAGEATFWALEDGQFLPVVLDPRGRLHSRALTGLWLRPEWLFAAPRPKVLDVLRAWGLV